MRSTCIYYNDNYTFISAIWMYQFLPSLESWQSVH